MEACNYAGLLCSIILVFISTGASLASISTLDLPSNDIVIRPRTPTRYRPDNAQPGFPETRNSLLDEIVCEGPLPPPPWPPHTYPQHYFSLTALCAYNSWNQLNMGCACAAPFVSTRVLCHAPPHSDIDLYNSDLRLHCISSCRCCISSVVMERPILQIDRRPRAAELSGKVCGLSPGRRQRDWGRNCRPFVTWGG